VVDRLAAGWEGFLRRRPTDRSIHHSSFAPLVENQPTKTWPSRQQPLSAWPLGCPSSFRTVSGPTPSLRTCLLWSPLRPSPSGAQSSAESSPQACLTSVVTTYPPHTWNLASPFHLTGRLTRFPLPSEQIGNHLGALSQWQKLVKEVAAQPAGERDSLFFSVVGLHALTVPQDPATLRAERREMFACLLALGLDDAGAVVFHQDQVAEHAELNWYLNCVTPVNRLMRMTSWKVRICEGRLGWHRRRASKVRGAWALTRGKWRFGGGCRASWPSCETQTRRMR